MNGVRRQGRLTLAPSVKALEDGDFIARQLDWETANRLYGLFRKAGVVCILTEIRVEEEGTKFSSEDARKAWGLD